MASKRGIEGSKKFQKFVKIHPLKSNCGAPKSAPSVTLDTLRASLDGAMEDNGQGTTS